LNFNFLKGDLRVSSKRFAAATLLTSGTLAWFFLIQFNVGDIFISSSQNPFSAYYVQVILFYGFGAISAIAGSLVSRKVDNRKFLLLWIVLGILSTALMSIFRDTILALFSSVLLGVSLGLGLPSSMAFIADSTTVEERGRVSGTTILGTFLLAFLAMAITRVLDLEITTSILVFALIRSTSLIALVLDKCERLDKIESEFGLRRPDYKDFVFYVLPWVMFILVGIFAWNLMAPQSPELASAISTGTILRFACIAIFGFASGFAADFFGRRYTIMTGLIILGVSFVILGFAISAQSIIIYLTTSGIAWGIFLSMYLVVPGDLAVSGSREKLYALVTILPLIIMGGLPYIPGFAEFPNYSSSFSQVLSLFLFLSIAPVLRAKETLPESSIRERRLKEHMKKVSKLIEESEKD
jgi:MFS family permease